MQRCHVLARDCVYLAADRAAEAKREQAMSLGLLSDDEVSDCEPSWPVSDGQPPERCSQEQRAAHCKWLCESVVVHVSIPAGLGLGHTNISSKVAASMYATSFECSNWSELEAMNHSFRAMRTDMGTELGLTSFAAENLHSALPEWHPWRRDWAPAFRRDDDPEDELDVSESTPKMMPNAVPIPGMCHMVDNLLHDVDVRLGGWEPFYESLKNCSALLCQDQARRRVWKTCVQKTHGSSSALFELSVPSLYEKRWSAVLMFLQRALPLLRLLRGCWDEQRYKADISNSGQEAGIVFDIKSFSMTLSNPQFFAFAEMVLHLHKVLEDIASFAEGCSCHEALLWGRSQHQRAKALSQDFPNKTHPICPMSGMRAPELAAGELQVRLLKAKDERLQLLRKSFVDASLPPAEWSKILADFDAGIAFVKSGLELKLAFWNTLPYKVAGLAHHHESVARRVAQECQEAYRSSTATVPFAFQHPLSKAVFGDHASEVERFVAGTRRADLRPKFVQLIASCLCWPTAERIIEATHKDAKKDIGLHRSSPVGFSLAIRSTAVLENVCREHMPLLLACISTSRSLKSVVRNLGLDMHPALIDQKEAHSTKIHTILSQVMYRTNVVDLFQNTAALQKINNANKMSAAKQWSKWMVQQRQPAEMKLTHTVVLRSALIQHVQSTGLLQDGCIVELPLPPDQRFHAVLEVTQAPPSLSATGGFVSDLDDEMFIAEPMVAEAEVPVSTKYFKVLHMTPSRWKTIAIPAVFGARVPTKAVLLAPLKVVFCNFADGIGAVVHDNDESPKLLIWEDHDLSLLQAHGRVWQVDSNGEPLFLLPNYTADIEMLSDLLRYFLEHRAVESQPTLYVNFHANDARLPLLESLLRNSDAYRIAVGPEFDLRCRLTQSGLERLQHGIRIHKPTPLAQLRADVTLENRTGYELQLLLMDSGWTWKALPNTKKARSRLSTYKQDSPKQWYSLTQVPSQYMMCLLTFAALVERGVDEIPHGEPASVYKKLLAGVPWKTQVAARESEMMPPLVPDVDIPAAFELDAEPPPPEGPPHADTDEHQSIDVDVTPDLEEELIRLMEAEADDDNDSDVLLEVHDSEAPVVAALQEDEPIESSSSNQPPRMWQLLHLKLVLLWTKVAASFLLASGVLNTSLQNSLLKHKVDAKPPLGPLRASAGGTERTSQQAARSSSQSQAQARKMLP